MDQFARDAKEKKSQKTKKTDYSPSSYETTEMVYEASSKDDWGEIDSHDITKEVDTSKVLSIIKISGASSTGYTHRESKGIELEIDICHDGKHFPVNATPEQKKEYLDLHKLGMSTKLDFNREFNIFMRQKLECILIKETNNGNKTTYLIGKANLRPLTNDHLDKLDEFVAPFLGIKGKRTAYNMSTSAYDTVEEPVNYITFRKINYVDSWASNNREKIITMFERNSQTYNRHSYSKTHDLLVLGFCHPKNVPLKEIEEGTKNLLKRLNAPRNYMNLKSKTVKDKAAYISEFQVGKTSKHG